MGLPARPSVILAASRSRLELQSHLEAIRATIARHASLRREVDVDGSDLGLDGPTDLVVVVGGDGTLIAQARRYAHTHVALVGVNVGRLGFLAEFDPKSFAQHAPKIFATAPSTAPPTVEHMMIHSEVLDDRGKRIHEGIAINDCVITAGEPFRMIELDFAIDGTAGPALTGDGVIIATPVGSTAYNVSAGGPIVHPAVEAMVITPLAAHSLGFRPIVVRSTSEIRVKVGRTNPGTSVMLDGQMLHPLKTGHEVRLRRHEHRIRFVTNPAATYWGILQDKLRWAAPPNYRDRGG